ncbi:MAG TPA: hypothetical protein VMB25_26910 [Bryobacteraceae bacterium]|nr:hypothetical protein [Bryobacteraceae bacterium]
MGRVALFFLVSMAVCAATHERVVTSVLPSLDYGASCWSTVTLQNLGNRVVTVEIEPHRAGGGLVPLEGLAQTTLRLQPGQRSSYRLAVTDETGEGWLKVRENVPSPELSPVVAVLGTSECVVSNQLRSTARTLSYPTRNPWFSGDIEEMHGNLISLVNTSERPATASLCYSEGNLYSVPGTGRATPELSPICSNAYDVQIPPYGARQFPVEHEGSSHFSIKTQGDAVVLQMLKPLETGVKVYTVDSSIKFGGEVTDEK